MVKYWWGQIAQTCYYINEQVAKQNAYCDSINDKKSFRQKAYIIYLTM